MIKNHKTLTNREKILRVLRRRKTPLSTKELAMKAGVNYNSARRELSYLYSCYAADRSMKKGKAFWTRDINT